MAQAFIISTYGADCCEFEPGLIYIVISRLVSGSIENWTNNESINTMNNNNKENNNMYNDKQTIRN